MNVVAPSPLEYDVTAVRIPDGSAIARCGSAEIPLATSLAGRDDAFNPAELLLTALAACMLKGMERVIPMIGFEMRGAEVRVHGVRQDSPPKLTAIDYEIIIDSDEPVRRLDLLHTNLRRYGTVSNTIAGAVPLNGVIRRKS